MKYCVLLYYKFVDISNSSDVVKEHQELCASLNLKGRVLIGSEGINGTVAGLRDEIETYKESMWKNPLFLDISFKESNSQENPFPKLQVKERTEVISLSKGKLSVKDGGEHISPTQLKELYDSGEEFYVFDTRNNYESIEGAFKDSITPNIDNFRDLPKALRNFKELKDKKIVTVCTGGIRCEKATVVFKKQGFTNVSQLDGGIVNYIHQYPGEYFEGDCYVFDNRMRLTQEQIAEGTISSSPSTGE